MKKILFLIFITAAVVNAYSQTNDSAENRQYLTSKATQNWFISFGGGANIYFGEFDKHESLGKRISYIGKLSVGKWFSPSVGFRAQFDIAGMKGFLNPYSTQFTVTDIARNHAYGAMDEYGYSKEKFNYFNSHLDLLVSIFKYRENRFYQLIPYLGVGYAFRFGYGENGGIHEGEFTLNAGIINRFRLSKSLDLDFETGMMFVNQRFDGSYGGQMLEGGFTATLGLNIKLGKTKTFARQQKPVECDYSKYEQQISDIRNNYDNKIKQLSDDLSKAQIKISDCEKQLNEKTQSEKPTVDEQKTIKETFEAVLFETNSDKLKDAAKSQIDKVADILKKYSNVTVKLSGHADSQGSISYNQKLSQRRAEAVKKYLHEKGVNNVIEIAAYGEERSVATNKTTEGRAKNRRTEIEIYIK
ncbi:MAG: OmpA family protein [Prevotellaceae bacterium]|jgi:outer membrane protein OmpA-like peptidoglycan-associated protein|nr:OmpA family protein [Prevotellaceae bacterium]